MKNWLINHPFALLLMPVIVWILIAYPYHLPYESSSLQLSTKWQQTLMSRYQQLGIQPRELATISALTLGYRGDLSKELKKQFSAAGAMHVLAVSGLHTGILMSVLLGLVTCFGLCKPLYEEHTKRVLLGLIVSMALVAFAVLTGLTPSVVRSVAMCSIFLLAWMCHRTSQMLNVLFASAFFILLFHPLDLYSVSFQLSYAAVFAIALFAPGWNRILPKNYFLGILGMSLAAQIGTMPISLYYFGQISNYFLLTNCIVLPLAWLMMVLGLITLTLGWFTPLGQLLAWLLNGLTWCMNETVGWIESLPYATTQVSLPLWGMWTLIGINLLLVIAWNQLTTPKLVWK